MVKRKKKLNDTYLIDFTGEPKNDFFFNCDKLYSVVAKFVEIRIDQSMGIIFCMGRAGL